MSVVLEEICHISEKQEKKPPFCRGVLSSVMMSGMVLMAAVVNADTVYRGNSLKSEQSHEANIQNRIHEPTHLSDEDRKAFGRVYAQLPEAVHDFEKMDFDGRMIQKEYLRAKAGDVLFLDTLRRTILKGETGEWDERVLMAAEIVALGRPAELINPDLPLNQVAAACGFKRVCAMMAFAQNNKTVNRHFLDDKDDFYRGALAAEIQAFDEAGHVFPVDKWLVVKRMFLAEIWHYGQKHPNCNVIPRQYSQFIAEQAAEKIKKERQATAFMAARQPAR